jgi:hypothetical protein
VADQLEGARTIPVKFRDEGDGSAAELLEVVNPAARPVPVAQQGAVLLPTGASSSAKQDLAQARLDLLATETKLEQVRALLAGTLAVDSELPPAAALADGTANPTLPGVDAHPELFNGTTWDRQRGNQPEVVGFASAARTGFVVGPGLINHNSRGILLRIIITTPGTGSLTLSIRSSNNHILASWVLTASGLYVMRPGVGTETGGLAAGQRSSIPLPRDFALACSTVDLWTYELRYSLLV